jgi:uncharacterized membrane protein
MPNESIRSVPGPIPAKVRILSIDIVRGLVMIVMALDHVRDFFHSTALTADPLDLQTTTPVLFFTRWITHFCAPTFVFLSGNSAWLSGFGVDKRQHGNFLMKRGLWLIIVDFVVITLFTSFNPNYNLIFLTVFWVIGWSMILTGLLARFASSLILPFGIVLFLAHDLAFLIGKSGSGALDTVIRIFLTGPVVVPLNPDHSILFAYAILPWAGVMFLGYYFGQFIQHKKFVLVTGIVFTLLFILLRVVNVYGDPLPYIPQDGILYNILSFINTSKYPPSLQFLCMTLGPALILLGLTGKNTSAFAKFVSVYGRVPFFYFVSHLLLAHILQVMIFFATGFSFNDINTPGFPFYFRPPGFGLDLGPVYLVWALVVLILYYPCKWFFQYKRKKQYWWLRYM